MNKFQTILLLSCAITSYTRDMNIITRCGWIALCLLVPATSWAEDVKVDGTDVTYPKQIDVDGQSLRITGTGLRKKFIFHVYTIASYVSNDAKVDSADALATLDAPKRFHLVMARGVAGKKMADAFRTALSANHDLSKLGDGPEKLEKYLSSAEAKEKDHIIFDHIVGKGVRVSRTGQEPLMLEGLPLAKAMWDIYLGPKNVGSNIKDGITSQLK